MDWILGFVPTTTTRKLCLVWSIARYNSQPIWGVERLGSRNDILVGFEKSGIVDIILFVCAVWSATFDGSRTLYTYYIIVATTGGRANLSLTTRCTISGKTVGINRSPDARFTPRGREMFSNGPVSLSRAHRDRQQTLYSICHHDVFLLHRCE